ncbi:MAG: nucleotidyltransferase family protein [Armatimonadota bacterium]
MTTSDLQAALAPEPRLLLAAVRLPHDDNAGQLVPELAQDADVHRLLELGRRHAVLPLCCYNLREAGLLQDLPEGLRAGLRDAYDASLARTTHIAALLGTVLDRAAETGLSLLCLKGPILAEQCYPHPSTRPMTDVDLLVRQADLGRAETLLAEAGYEPLPATANPVYVRGPADGEGMWDLQVELHTELLTGALGNRKVARLETRHVWERAQEAALMGRPCLSLSTADNIIFLGAHMTVHHGKIRLIWLADLAYFLRARGDSVRWEEVVEAAARYGVRPAVGWPLRLARELVGANVPEDVLLDLRAGPQHACPARFLEPSTYFGDVPMPGGDPGVLGRAMFLEHWRDRFFYFAEVARAAGPAAWPSLACRFLRAAVKK